MASAINVAQYIIKSIPVDNLKLQKLLYYSQAVFLVLNNKTPLFSEEIEAWDYGPVVREVYDQYKKHGCEIIPQIDIGESGLEVGEMEAIDMVLEYYGEMSGGELVNKTHQEKPWKETYHPKRPSNIISKDLIYDYFKDVLEFSE
jgi:uncharacterized phage-associated protein